MPPELQRLIEAVDAAEADARHLVYGLTDAQGNWQPGGGMGWSIAQCLDHLRKINSFYVGPFLEAVQRAYADERRPFDGVRLTWFGRQWIAVLEPPVTWKAKAPATLQPRSAIPIADAFAGYVESHEPYRAMVELANHVDVNRVTAANPLIKVIRVRVATALHVVPAHDRRHLWQARRVLASPGFPKG